MTMQWCTMQVDGLEQPKPKAKPRVEQNRVLVTGGAGFVGSHLCTFLVERGDQVREGPVAAFSAPCLCRAPFCRQI